MSATRFPLALVAVMVGSIALAGCGQDLKAKVESNTSWSGAFGNRSVDGSGSKTVDLPDDRPQCAVVQKSTQGGSLTVRIICENTGLAAMFGAEDEEDSATTTAAYGVVSVCSDAE
jgi:hypothetical protein